MSRVALLAVALVALPQALAACSKAATGDGGNTGAKGNDRVMVPGGAPDKVALPNGEGARPPTGDSPQMKLTPEEGVLVIEVPKDAKAKGETTVKVAVTAAEKYKVNIEFPSKLTLTSPSGVTLAKAEFKAGGHDKSKGDAEVFDDHQLQFLVKLTPADAGNFTINGNFKFAVCDKAGSQCLPKKMPIAIQVAAK